MYAVTKHLTELRIRMAEALPEHVIADDYVDFSQRRQDELLKGIVSVLCPDVQTDSEWTCTAHLTVVGQIEVPTRDAKPSDGEAAEQLLAGHIRAFLRNPGKGLPKIRVTKLGFSAQQEHPYHWCAFKCEMGPIDEVDGLGDGLSGDEAQDALLYPPSVNPQPLAGVDIKIDVAPHESTAQHDAWLAGDETPNPPDAKLTMEFNDANPQTN